MKQAIGASVSEPEPQPAPNGSELPDYRVIATLRRSTDLLLGRIRLRVNGIDYVLPVLKSAPNQRWLDKLDRETRVLLAGVQGDTGSGQDIVRTLSDRTLIPKVRSALHEYDATGVLPAEAVLSEQITDMEYVMALLEVWAAASPLPVIGLDLVIAILNANGSQPTNTQPEPTVGRPRRSRRN